MWVRGSDPGRKALYVAFQAFIRSLSISKPFLLSPTISPLRDNLPSTPSSKKRILVLFKDFDASFHHPPSCNASIQMQRDSTLASLRSLQPRRPVDPLLESAIVYLSMSGQGTWILRRSKGSSLSEVRVTMNITSKDASCIRLDLVVTQFCCLHSNAIPQNEEPWYLDASLLLHLIFKSKSNEFGLYIMSPQRPKSHFRYD